MLNGTNILSKAMEKITKVWFRDERVYVSTDKGNTYSRSLRAFPLLMEASDAQRERYDINKFGDAIRWEEIDEDIHLDSFLATEEIKPNVISETFARFPQLNVSEIARTIGINKTLLAKYIYGTKTPSQERIDLILDTIRRIGRDMAQI